LARRQLRRGDGNQTLSTTEVVHEAYLKLSAQERAAWNDRCHFFAVASTAMRQILVDHARRRRRSKRGGGAAPTSFDEVRHSDAGAPADGGAEYLLALNDALDRLALDDPTAARVLECRYFVGLSDLETARALALSPRAVQRSWQKAKSWLAKEMGGSAAATAPPAGPAAP
jgi:RNA polymerase sigma factor (TIGR02999 family)